MFFKKTEDDPFVIGNFKFIIQTQSLARSRHIFHEPISVHPTGMYLTAPAQKAAKLPNVLVSKSWTKTSIFQSLHLKTGCCVFIDFKLPRKPHTLRVGMLPPPGDPRLNLHLPQCRPVLLSPLAEPWPYKGVASPTKWPGTKVNEGCLRNWVWKVRINTHKILVMIVVLPQLYN